MDPRRARSAIGVCPDSRRSDQWESHGMNLARKPGDPLLAAVEAGDAMHTGVFTCPPSTPLVDVARMMTRYRIHAVVVTHDEPDEDDPAGVWGVVSDLDVASAAAVDDVHDRTAGGTAHTALVMVYPDDPLLRVAELMKQHHVTHALVVARETERPVGMLSGIDVARHLAAAHRVTAATEEERACP
jgi:CBS domain-containing protein